MDLRHPYKLTNEHIDAITDVYRNGGKNDAAAKVAGVARSTLWRWLELGRECINDPHRKDEILEADSHAPDFERLYREICKAKAEFMLNESCRAPHGKKAG